MSEFLIICKQYDYALQISLAITATGNFIFFIFARLDYENQNSLDGWNIEYS